MKFDDIKKFTKWGNYQINVPLRMFQGWLDRHEEDGLQLQLNPDFQRGHVWTKVQQVKYLEFILKGGKSGLILYFNHPGWMTDFQGEFVCVDGLQRITTITKFLNNKLKVYGAYYKDYDYIPFDVNMIVNINNLETRQEVLQWYLDLNTGGTIHKKQELDKVKELLKQEQGKVDFKAFIKKAGDDS